MEMCTEQKSENIHKNGGKLLSDDVNWRACQVAFINDRQSTDEFVTFFRRSFPPFFFAFGKFSSGKC
jgi:hypothetical protein